jgi:fructokinase
MLPADPAAALKPAVADTAGVGPDPALRLGVDLGGTKMEAVIVRFHDDTPQVLSRLRRPTERERGYDHIVQAVATLIADVTAQAGLTTPPPIGVGMPGSIARSRGTVKNSNTTCLNGRPFRADLIARVGLPIEFSNDANCFALAEARYGAGRGHSVVFGVILGTGVGGGLAFGPTFGSGDLASPPASPSARSHVWDGPQGIAGEWGHVSLSPDGPPCYCGRRGCIETYLCGPAIEALYVKRGGSSLPLAEIDRRAEAGDPIATRTLAEIWPLFGRALATVINILDPSVIVLGGGVSHLSGLYTHGIPEVARHVFSDELTTPIVRHQIGDSAGVLGAALLPRLPL